MKNKKLTLDIDSLADKVTRELKEDLYPDIEVTKTKSSISRAIRHIAETGKDDEDFFNDSGVWIMDEIEREHRETYGDDPVTKRIKRDDIRDIVKKHTEQQKKIN